MSGVGEVTKTGNLIIESVQAKAATAIAKGQLIVNDNAGFVPATSSVVGTSKCYVALDSIAATAPNRVIRALIRGRVTVKKTAASSAMYKGRKVMVGTTAGTAALTSAATDVTVGEVAEDSPAGEEQVTLWV